MVIMPVLNPRQERFVRIYATGKSATAAYAESYGRTGHSAEASGARLLRNVEVQARLEELREKANQEASISLANMVGRLRAMLETPIAALDEHHPFTKRIVVSESKRAGDLVKSVRIVEKDSPLAILGEISRLLGLYDIATNRPDSRPLPERVTVAEFVAEMEAR